MDTYKYQLEKGSKKHLCPGCCKRRFVRYVNIEDGNYLPEQYGRCDRESQCSYHVNPYHDDYANNLQRDYNEAGQKQYARAREVKRFIQPARMCIPNEVFNSTLQNYEQNTFIQNLLNRVAYPFEAADIEKVISLYYLGTVVNGYRAGAVTFPFINYNGNVTAIQVKQFDNDNHTTGTDFLHSIIEKHLIRNKELLPHWLEQYIKQDKRINSLFGEHLLSKYPHNPVALVEAPKTAVYGSLYFGWPNVQDNFIWLAVYNKSSFTLDKLKVLKGRDVYIFPDLSKDGSTYNEWQQKAEIMQKQLPGTRFIFSNLLEELAPEAYRNNGSDLADFLIQLNWRNFRDKENIVMPQQFDAIVLPSEKSEKREHSEKTFFNEDNTFNNDTEFIAIPKKEDWNKAIDELETFFAACNLSKEPIRLNQCSIITDVDAMFKSHIAIVKANNGKTVFLPYLERLQELMKILKKYPTI